MAELASTYQSWALEHSTPVDALPKITFGMIVLNGEPFIQYNLRALYPFAHQIIVVEGACPASHHNATSDGHSIDRTCEILHRFKIEEDPEDKVTIVTAEAEGYPNGFWIGEKDEQSRAYAKRATGDWLWQVDCDEFYHPDDMKWICRYPMADPDVFSISFRQIQFWGGLQYFTDGWYLRHYFTDIHRIFRWKEGFSYSSHRPPTVIDAMGTDLRRLGWVSGKALAKRNIYMYHYSLVFPSQVKAKSAYYKGVEWGSFVKMSQWADQNYLQIQNPYRVHNVYRYPSWLERYTGQHPPQVLAMWESVQHEELDTHSVLRATEDVEHLLHSRRYQIGILVLKLSGPIVYHAEQNAFRLACVLPLSARSFLKRRFFSNNGAPSNASERSHEDLMHVRMLNLGCGARFHPDWINIDHVPSEPSILAHDLRRRLPFPDNYFDVVYHSHVLEHFGREEGLRLLQECYRVCRHGGVVRVVVPNLETIAQLYIKHLDNALRAEPHADQLYDWTMLELYDQVTRTHTGGDVANFVRSAPPVMASYLITRVGNSLYSSLRNRESPSQPFRRLFRLISHPSRVWQIARVKLAYGMLFAIWGRSGVEMAREVVFRQQGEIHRRMYDRYSLRRALEEVGFVNVSTCRADTSCIEDWQKFGLDSDPDGTVYKPDSLYCEARKPGSQ